MKNKIFAVFSVSLICFLGFLCGSVCAKQGEMIQNKEEKIMAIKQAKEVDLPALRDRAKFLKQKLEELKSQSKSGDILASHTLSKGVDNIIDQMNKIAVKTELPIKIDADRSGDIFSKIPPFIASRRNISQLIMKAEEIIVVIDSVIGKEK